MCSKSFGKASDLKLHVRTVHMDIIDYECVICGKSFGKNNHLNRHLKPVHKCRILNIMFFREKALLIKSSFTSVEASFYAKL